MPMIKKPKVTQITFIEMPQLVHAAHVNGIKDTTDVVKWIISVSSYWRAKGYQEIIKEINNIR